MTPHGTSLPFAGAIDTFPARRGRRETVVSVPPRAGFTLESRQPPDVGIGMSGKRNSVQLKVLTREIVAPTCIAIVVLVALDVLLRSAPVVGFIDANRPVYGETSLAVHVQKQLWHVQSLALRNEPRIAVVGSSSVANGVDPEIVRKNMGQGAVAVENLGMTGLLAYELPLLSGLILTPATKAVVYLYNGFSFADRFHPDAVDIRWDAAEALRLKPLSDLEAREVARYLDRLPGELLWSVRYRDLVRTMALRLLTGTARPLPYPWDFPPDAPPPPAQRPRQPRTPLPETDWLRKAHLDSADKEDTLGYRGLRRFCEQARNAGIPLIVAPVVEPEFAMVGPYAQGADRDTVDRRVKALSEACGATFLHRDDFRDIERQDGLFTDIVHLHATGRAAYSARLGALLRGRP